jgi:ElaB/YqjD/DUF883 family membrane-anchored ribosome-binding protein
MLSGQVFVHCKLYDKEKGHMDPVTNLAKQGQSLADRAADSADELRSDAAPLLKDATGRARALGNQGIDAISDMASQVRDVAVDASGSIIAYTKKNPATALAIAAVSGALLFGLVKILTPSRD